MSKAYQVVGIGNAVSDVIATSSDDFLAEHGVEKGIMRLVDQPRAEALFAAMGSRTETPGGSVANTIAGLGSLGLRTAFIGRVADDDLGHSYALAMQTEGTDFPNPPVRNAELPTSRSMIFVSPDGERSMNTYLGISSDVGPEDVSDAVIADCEILFLEGYLFDKAPGKEAFRKAASLARQSGARAGISLSDPFCVDRHRDDFRKLVAGPLDFFLCNEEELKSLYQTDDLAEALKMGPLIVSWWCARARRRACRYAKQISDGTLRLSRLSRWMPQVQAINLPLAFYMGWCKGLIWRPAARSVVLPPER